MVKRASPMAVLFLTVTLDLVGFGMVVPLMPLYAERLGASGAAIAWLMASYSLMQFAFAPLWGRLSDRVGRRPVLLISIAGHAASLLGFALATTYTGMLVSRLLAGACTANLAVASAYVADSTDAAGRARGMGTIGAAFGLGFVIGPFFAGELSVYGPAAPALVAAALAASNWILAAAFLPESHPPGRRQKLQNARAPWWQERLGVLRLAPQLWPLFSLTFLQVCGFAMMEMALVLFVERRFGFVAGDSGRLLAYIGLVLVVVQGGLLGPLVRRAGEARLIRVGLVCMASALVALPAVRHGQVGALLGVLALLGFGQGMVGPCLSSSLSRAVPAGSQGAALGLSQSLGALARTVGPAAAGPLFDAGGEGAPLYAAGLLVAGAFLLALATLRGVRPGAPVVA